MNSRFIGTGVALVTPFNNIGEIDFTSLKSLVENVITKGVDFLVAMGTTSEAATLNTKEKEAVLKTIIDQNLGNRVFPAESDILFELEGYYD